jgi:hypothetical protein
MKPTMKRAEVNISVRRRTHCEPYNSFLIYGSTVSNSTRTRGPKFGPISYLPILPPLWAALPEDNDLYPRPRPFQWVPDTVLKLDGRSSCSCEARRTFYDPCGEVFLRPCVIFGLLQSMECQTELQVCKTCTGNRRRRRYIGPETRNLGIFNFNNHVFVCHDVLDDYTSAYASSETPFTAWVTVMNRRYITQHSSLPFMSEQMFRTIWFAYVNLQHFEGDMKCPRCGPTPEDTIWDGVTLAFHEKHLLPTLRPPTFSDQTSASRPARYIKRQQVLPDRKLRQIVKKIVTSNRSEPKTKIIDPATISSGEDTDSDGGPPTLHNKTSRTGKQQEDVACMIPDVVKQLKAVNQSLGEIFDNLFGLNSSTAKLGVPGEWRDLFLQVRPLN